jgi:Sporulation and spore germination
MSRRTDRSVQSNRMLLGVVIILAAIVATGVFMLWMQAPSSDTVREPAVQDQQIDHQRFLRNEPLSITLYYPHEGMLATESAVVKRQPDTQSLSRATLAALFADQRAALEPVLRDIRLRALYIGADDTAYIDLTPGPQKYVRASAWEEQLAIYSLVNTLLQNFEEITQVKLLVDGREAQTLAGHMDLSRAFTKRMDLVRQ